ncbi:MAG: glycosyltransferase family 39 protein [Chloroflexi bacterium]|nr:glycosyltransferase family 39 protein [Chloroflexota bacterium]
MLRARGTCSRRRVPDMAGGLGQRMKAAASEMLRLAHGRLRRGLAPLRAVARSALLLLFRQVAGVWRWFDSLNIPLSPLQWLLGFYAIFGVLYLFATPIFEANEELWHFGYVQRLRETSSLPVQDLAMRDTVYGQHGSQPPLYYLAIAAVTAPIRLDDADAYRQLNPHVLDNQPAAFGNKNRVAHDESLPAGQGTGLAVLVARIVGLLLGAGTIYFVYHIGQIIAPQRPTVAFVAAALTALNPMFIFVSASVNNDSLAMCLNSALVLLLLRTLRDGFSTRASLAMALPFGLACLTKITSLVLLPALLGVALFLRRKTGDRRGLLTMLALLALGWLLIAGWWYIRNLQLYGEPLGIITQTTLAGTRGMYFDLADLFTEFHQFRMSYWGLFGASNIQLGSIVYVLFDLATFLSLAGCLFLILQLLAIRDFAYARYELAHLLTLAGSLALLWLGILYLSSLTPVTQGRLLFPLIGVISPLLAVGLVEAVWWLVFWLRPPSLDFVRAGDAVPAQLLRGSMLWQLRALGIIAFLVPLTVIAGQYDAPSPVDSPPPNSRPVYADYGDVALIAYEHSDRRYSAGDQVRLTLYWQVLAPSTDDNSLALRLVDDNLHAIGSYTTYPGAGSLRTSQWREAAIYPDEYIIPISAAAYGGYPLDLRVEWQGKSGSIHATDGSGRHIEPVLLDIGAVVTPRQQPAAGEFNAIPADEQPVFDEVIRLEGFSLSISRNEITLHWKADSAPEENYTVFAHLLDEGDEILSQADAAPRLPTRYWRWGETFTTYHQFPPEPSMLEHQVLVGLYLRDINGYPKAEFVLQPQEDPESPTPDSIQFTEDATEDEAEGEELADEFTEESEEILDAYAINWEAATEVLALTPTPEPAPDEENSEAASVDET